MYNKRKEDQLINKVIKYAGLLAAAGIICGATIKALSYEFVSQKDFKTDQAFQDQKIQQTEIDQTRVIEKLDGVSKDVTTIKEILLK